MARGNWIVAAPVRVDKSIQIVARAHIVVQVACVKTHGLQRCAEAMA
jgi:hypothetical protein